MKDRKNRQGDSQNIHSGSPLYIANIEGTEVMQIKTIAAVTKLHALRPQKDFTPLE
jgi:hypothetical protein